MSARPAAVPRSRRPRNSLNQQVIVDAALVIADRDGLEGLTFQALGAELGAHHTAVYRHFRDKDDLLLALVDALHAEVWAQSLDITADWTDVLRALAHRVRAVLLRHPHIGQLLAARTARREHEYRTVDAVIGALLRAGFDAAQAARLYRVFSDFVLAYAALDAALASLPEATRVADLAAWTTHYRALPASDYPSIVAVSAYLPDLDDPQNFATAVDLMIAAIAASPRTATDHGDGRFPVDGPHRRSVSRARGPHA